MLGKNRQPEKRQPDWQYVAQAAQAAGYELEIIDRPQLDEHGRYAPYFRIQGGGPHHNQTVARYADFKAFKICAEGYQEALEWLDGRDERRMVQIEMGNDYMISLRLEELRADYRDEEARCVSAFALLDLLPRMTEREERQLIGRLHRIDNELPPLVKVCVSAVLIGLGDQTELGRPIAVVANEQAFQQYAAFLLKVMKDYRQYFQTVDFERYHQGCQVGKIQFFDYRGQGAPPEKQSIEDWYAEYHTASNRHADERDQRLRDAFERRRNRQV